MCMPGNVAGVVGHFRTLRREDLGWARLDGPISIIWPIVSNAPLARCLAMAKETAS